MVNNIFVYDPTASDKQSAVRGIGRYLQILKENFPEWNFSSLFPSPYSLVPIYINPFFNLLQPPVRTSHDLSLLGRKIAKKQIAVIHDLIPLKYPTHFPAGIRGNINILLNKLALKNYDLIITDSEASKADIIKILDIRENRIKVIYPCLTQIFTNNKLQITNNKSITNTKYQINKTTNYELRTTPYCMYVGDATWNKNLINLAHAIKLANINCVFVGKIFDRSNVQTFQRSNVVHPWLTELNEFLELTKNDKHFRFLGFVSDLDLIKLYKQAEFNILPSRDEGFGFSYIEAAQFGCPSLLSNIPVLKEISDGKALFFDQNNPQDIADKIKQIISDKNLKNKIGEDAKKRSEYFSAEKFKREFLSVIPA